MTLPTHTPPIRAALEEAVAHHRAGRLAEAEQRYRKVLQAVPQEPDANHNLGQIALAVGRRDVALPLFRRALAADPRQPHFVAALVSTLLDLGKDAEARLILQQGFDQGVRNPVLNTLSARAEAARDRTKPQPEEEVALLRLFNLGLHDEVQREARRLLAMFPGAGVLWKILGASLHVQGANGPEVLEGLQKAATLLPLEPDAQNNLAVALRTRGDFAAAADYSRRALQLQPGFIEARRNLGSALHGLGDYTGAATCFAQALEARPDPDLHINLGLCLLELGRHDEALAHLHDAARLAPDKAVAHHQLGTALMALGRKDEAIPAFQRALELDPRAAGALNNFGNILQDKKQIEEAMAYYRRALDAEPDYADAHNNLGVALQELGRREEAAASFRQAIACREQFAQAHSNLGNLLEQMGKQQEALIHARKAVEIDPQLAEAWDNLGHVLHAARHYDDAMESFERALALKPGLANAYSNLASLQRDMGQLGLAVQSCQTALQHDPGHLEAHSVLLFSGNYLPNEPGATLLEQARRYGVAAAARARPYTAWSNTPEPERRLRIGFVSADLYRHPVGFFLDSVIAALRTEQGANLELYAYANDGRRDDLTERLQANFHHWHSTLGTADDKLARKIHEDGIDILVDLSGHTTGTRLAMFAWKPAPVQASWLGYFATTGLGAIDYLVADPWTLPPEEEVHFSETIVRLPETRLCFSEPDADAPVGPLPALAGGSITFGCCNNLSKLGDAVVALWARILHAVPGSRLFLKNKQFSEPARCDEMLRRFAAHGIDAGRLILEGPSLRDDYLRTYDRIDIALDPFPYTGGTTTVEALWMGVPVLTLAGERFIARQGIGLLANAGLADWIAPDAQAYLVRAVAAASDLPALARLRAGLRGQLLASPLFDAPRFAGHFAKLLRDMWRTWCERQTNTVKTGNILS